jgi:hypothetical protein
MGLDVQRETDMQMHKIQVRLTVASMSAVPTIPAFSA